MGTCSLREPGVKEDHDPDFTSKYAVKIYGEIFTADCPIDPRASGQGLGSDRNGNMRPDRCPTSRSGKSQRPDRDSRLGVASLITCSPRAPAALHPRRAEPLWTRFPTVAADPAGCGPHPSWRRLTRISRLLSSRARYPRYRTFHLTHCLRKPIPNLTPEWRCTTPPGSFSVPFCP